MPTKAKIRIHDHSGLRTQIDMLYEQAYHADLAKWALAVSQHILKIAGIDYQKIPELADGFGMNKAWQAGKARMYDVRQAGFAANKVARACCNQAEKAALRAAVQAIGSGHMREHAMVASDYAIKAINLLYPGDMDAVTAERQWQLSELKKCFRTI